MTSFSWHAEYYGNALRQISNTAGKQYYAFLNGYGEQDIGWLEFFIREYPVQHKKYQDALIQLDILWGDMAPKAMEEFKKAVKIEVDGTKWAVDKYLDWQRERMQAEAMKGRQESLIA